MKEKWRRKKFNHRNQQIERLFFIITTKIWKVLIPWRPLTHTHITLFKRQKSSSFIWNGKLQERSIKYLCNVFSFSFHLFDFANKISFLISVLFLSYGLANLSMQSLKLKKNIFLILIEMWKTFFYFLSLTTFGQNFFSLHSTHISHWHKFRICLIEKESNFNKWVESFS
jgi:hypothetical protein